MLLDLDRQGDSGVQRVELDHGREQGEALDVTVELASKEKCGLQRRRQEVMLLGRNQNGLHGHRLQVRLRAPILDQIAFASEWVIRFDRQLFMRSSGMQ